MFDLAPIPDSFSLSTHSLLKVPWTPLPIFMPAPLNSRPRTTSCVSKFEATLLPWPASTWIGNCPHPSLRASSPLRLSPQHHQHCRLPSDRWTSIIHPVWMQDVRTSTVVSKCSALEIGNFSRRGSREEETASVNSAFLSLESCNLASVGLGVGKVWTTSWRQRSPLTGRWSLLRS